MSTEEQRQFLRNRGLYAGGEDDDVLIRALEHECVPDFSTMSLKSVRRLCRTYGLPDSGTKVKCQDRIIDHVVHLVVSLKLSFTQFMFSVLALFLHHHIHN